MFEVSRHRLSLLVVTFFLAVTCLAVAQEADKSAKKAKSGDDPAQDQQNVDPLKRQLPESKKARTIAINGAAPKAIETAVN